MQEKRTPVDVSTLTQNSRPVRSFDTFTAARADPSAGRSAQNLANALGVAMNTGAQFVKQYTDTEIEEGKKAFLTGLTADGERIRKGEISETQSSYWMKGFHIAEGQHQATLAGIELTNRWEQSDLKNNPDPEAFSKFVQDNLADLAKGNGTWNENVQAGYAASIPQVIQQLAAKQKHAVNEYVKEQRQEHLGAQIGALMTQYNDGLVDKKTLGAGYVSLIDNYIALGADKRDAKMTAAKMFSNQMLDIMDEQPQKVLKLLGGFPKESKAWNPDIDAMLISLKDKAIAQIASNRTRDNKEAKEQASIIRGTVYREVTNNPNFVRSPEFKALEEKLTYLDPDGTNTFISTLAAKVNGTYTYTVSKETEQHNMSQIKRQLVEARDDQFAQNEIITNASNSGFVQRTSAIAELQAHAEKVRKNDAFFKAEGVKTGRKAVSDAFDKGSLDKINQTLMDVNPGKLRAIEDKATAHWDAFINELGSRIEDPEDTQAINALINDFLRGSGFTGHPEGLLGWINDQMVTLKPKQDPTKQNDKTAADWSKDF